MGNVTYLGNLTHEALVGLLVEQDGVLELLTSLTLGPLLLLGLSSGKSGTHLSGLGLDFTLSHLEENYQNCKSFCGEQLGL